MLIAPSMRNSHIKAVTIHNKQITPKSLQHIPFPENFSHCMMVVYWAHLFPGDGAGGVIIRRGDLKRVCLSSMFIDSWGFRRSNFKKQSTCYQTEQPEYGMYKCDCLILPYTPNPQHYYTFSAVTQKNCCRTSCCHWSLTTSCATSVSATFWRG